MLRGGDDDDDDDDDDDFESVFGCIDWVWSSSRAERERVGGRDIEGIFGRE